MNRTHLASALAVLTVLVPVAASLDAPEPLSAAEGVEGGPGPPPSPQVGEPPDVDSTQLTPWVESAGDTMTGDLVMGLHALRLNPLDEPLFSPAPGALRFGGKPVCFLGECGAGSVTLVDTGPGLAGGPITTSGLLRIPNDGIASAMLQNGSVGLPKLSFDPATQAELDAHSGGGDHDARYPLRTDLNGAGVLNAASNPLHWTRLKGVPAGIADGGDADLLAGIACSDGQVLKTSGGAWTCGTDIDTDTDTDTTYTAGPGLLLAGSTFQANLSEVQARVGACPTSTAIRAVGDAGTVTCEADDDTLLSLGCSEGQVARVNTGAWGCADDADTTYDAGAGLQLSGTTLSIASGGVAGTMVANGAVGSAHLAAGAVTSDRIADGAVGNQKIANGAVTAAKLGELCASGEVLKRVGAAWACASDLDTTYTAGEGLSLSGAHALSLAQGGVGNLHLANGAVTAAKLADGSVTAAKLGEVCADGQVLKRVGTSWACAADDDSLASLACTAGEVAEWAGGWGCGSDGDVLGSLACASGQVPKYGTGVWGCGSDNDSGDITNVAVQAGSGLTGGATSGAVTLGTDLAILQKRVAGSCAAGSAIGGIDAAGGATCNALGWVDDGSSVRLGSASDQVGIGTASPAAKLHVEGDARLNGTVRMGSQSVGLTPDFGLLMRRVNLRGGLSDVANVSQTDVLLFQRNGTAGGFRITTRVATTTLQSLDCMGVNQTGGSVNKVVEIGSGVSANTNFTVYADGESIVYLTCTFGSPFGGANHSTTVTIHRKTGDFWWSGYVVSTLSQ